MKKNGAIKFLVQWFNYDSQQYQVLPHFTRLIDVDNILGQLGQRELSENVRLNYFNEKKEIMTRLCIEVRYCIDNYWDMLDKS